MRCCSANISVVRFPHHFMYKRAMTGLDRGEFVDKIIDVETKPVDVVDLALADHGGKVLWVTDDYFAEGAHLLKSEPAIFEASRYTERGKWMDGWESRRRRTPGHDTAIIELGMVGTPRLININTAHFTGNYPAFAQVLGCYAPDASLEQLRHSSEWAPLTKSVALKGGASNFVTVRDTQEMTHVKLEIFPAGGVARLRVYGDPNVTNGTELTNLIAEETGARAIACSDMYFSEMQNLLKRHPPLNMGDGWETKRSRPPKDDWVIIALPKPGCPTELEVHTTFFKGNYPEHFLLESVYWPDAEPWQLLTLPIWDEMVPKSSLGPDGIFRVPVSTDAPITHVRLKIFPDGGVARLRLNGYWSDGQATSSSCEVLNQLEDAKKRALFFSVCGAERWVSGMLNLGPFVSEAHLRGSAEALWWSLDEHDWRESFTHHPRIGEDVEKLREKFGQHADQSLAEQRGIETASEDTLLALAQGNRDYYEKFGYIFIVCASNKSADEMLQNLRQRMTNTPENEIRIAAGEQAKITWLRIQKNLFNRPQ